MPNSGVCSSRILPACPSKTKHNLDYQQARSSKKLLPNVSHWLTGSRRHHRNRAYRLAEPTFENILFPFAASFASHRFTSSPIGSEASNFVHKSKANMNQSMSARVYVVAQSTLLGPGQGVRCPIGCPLTMWLPNGRRHH